jgi:hypothetical protein
LRCYFIRDNQIEFVELLTGRSDDDAIQQASALATGKTVQWDRYEVWDGRRLVYRYPPGTVPVTSPSSRPSSPT